METLFLAEKTHLKGNSFVPYVYLPVVMFFQFAVCEGLNLGNVQASPLFCIFCA